MYDPHDPRQRNWHRQNAVGRGGGFEQEPRYGTPSHDWRDRGMYGEQDRPHDREDARGRQDYQAASDQGEAERLGGGGYASRGQSSFVRQDRGTWGSLGPRRSFGPDMSNPGFPPNAPTGAFAGRGPKGYRRADERIQDDVCERLTEDPEVDASEIEVQVQEGEVTLEGTVDSRRTKRRAEDVIESISGITEIHNRLRIGKSPT